MAGRFHKELSCKDVMGDCGFLVRAETEDEVMNVASGHGCRVHGKCKISADTERMIRSLIRSEMLRGSYFHKFFNYPSEWPSRGSFPVQEMSRNNLSHTRPRRRDNNLLSFSSRRSQISRKN